MTLYLLCNACRRAWIGPVAASCCGAAPIVCSPWSSDARTWLGVRLRDRVVEVYTTAHRGTKEHKRSLLKGIRGKGNTSARLSA